MRPPEFTGGNKSKARATRNYSKRFNEAAGIHRRKPEGLHRLTPGSKCFNEAAGIHRRKLRVLLAMVLTTGSASMRPPEFTGGNRPGRRNRPTRSRSRFNEAAGIHRRKRCIVWIAPSTSYSSFNEAAGIHRRKQNLLCFVLSFGY